MKMTRKVISKLWVQGILHVLKFYIKLRHAIFTWYQFFFFFDGLKFYYADTRIHSPQEFARLNPDVALWRQGWV